MTRRLLLMLPLAACLRADSDREIEELIASAASGLSAGRPEVFLEAFDRAMPGFDTLRTAVVALVDESAVSCSVEVTESAGDDSERSLTLDWLMRLGPKGDNPTTTVRQQRVKCRLKKTGKKWRIVSFEPLELFAPHSR